jgi:hypothetical protein
MVKSRGEGRNVFPSNLKSGYGVEKVQHCCTFSLIFCKVAYYKLMAIKKHISDSFLI